MTAINAPVLTFQGGIIGGELHNRVDIQTYPQGAEEMSNYRPTLQGVMQRRPPMEHIDLSDDHTKRCRNLPFVFNVDTSYLVNLTEDRIAFYSNDVRVTTETVSSTMAASWTDLSTVPSSITVIGDDLWLDADGANYAIAEKAITVAGGDTAKTHVLAFEIKHGPLDVRIGTTSGDADVMRYDRLRAGDHRLAFIPGATTIYLQVKHNNNAGRYIADNVEILPGPEFTLPCPYDEADLPALHVQQIRDVLYITHGDYWPRRLERRGAHSWSLVKFEPDDGPFGDLNTSDITIAASATTGEVTLTASEDLFDDTDVGVIYQLTAGGTTKTTTAVSDNIFTPGIKVSGGDGTRSFEYDISGTFVGSVHLQYSNGNENGYSDVGSSFGFPKSGGSAASIYDGKINETLYYRLGVKPGNYTSGTINMMLTYKFSSSNGKVRILEIVSPTQATAEVTSALASTEATKTWRRGDWNTTDGFPVSIASGYGRLWFARGSRVWPSKSDDFTAFESVVDEKDSSFSRNLASPSSDGIRWLAMVNHLIIGTASFEQVGLGNTQAEPIGPANFQFLPGTEEGGSDIQPIVIGGSILFVHRNRRQLMQFTQNPKALSETSYVAVDLTARAPEILDDRIAGIAYQKEPDRRIYVWLDSGKLCELLFRREGEIDVVAWSTVETTGRVEDVVVMPREDEDVVYISTRRTASDGSTIRAIEKLGRERVLMDCDRYHLDSALGYTLSKPATTAAPSDTTGSITITTDDDAFVVGDVGKVLWINGGRGTITAWSNARTVTMTVTSALTNDDPCPGGRWGLNATTSTFTGLSHLNGRSVRVWGDMLDLGTATVSAGSIALPQAVSVAYAGLSYRSRWKSLKLAYGAQKGTAIGMRKAVKSVILLLFKCGSALTYGRMFSKMRPVSIRTPDVPYGEPVPLFSGEKDHAFDAHYDPDARICLEVDGPAPATIAGYVLVLDEKDR